MTSPYEYYEKQDVSGEIIAFLRNRWAAAYIPENTWVRWRGNAPLTISSEDDLLSLVRRGARSFYGTIEVFRRLEHEYDVLDGYSVNVIGASSFIDIDIIDDSRVYELWHYVTKVAGHLATWLSERADGVYVLWSGAGAHVRVCWSSLSGAAGKLGLDPVYVSYIVAEYVLRKNIDKIKNIITQASGIKLENMVGRNRVFTAPLSLHRKLDLVAVALKPEDTELFTLSWAQPEHYRHDPDAWRVSGSALQLVEEALEFFGDKTPERTVIAPEKKRIAKTTVSGRIGRFPVMALLQAARYYVLNRDLAKAKSFGLNRAIFYAWAKYYGPARSAYKHLRSVPGGRYGSTRAQSYRLLRVPGMKEEAPISDSGYFVMGGVEQRPEDFDRNVARKFEEAGIPFETAWKAAVEYVSRFPPSVLKDPRLFYERVYLPVRDNFWRLLSDEPVRRYYRKAKPDTGKRETKPAPRRSLLDWIGED